MKPQAALTRALRLIALRIVTTADDLVSELDIHETTAHHALKRLHQRRWVSRTITRSGFPARGKSNYHITRQGLDALEKIA